MSPNKRRPQFLAPLVYAALIGLVAGCAFIASHEVAVDAISGPNPPPGQAYRLVDKDVLVAREARQHKLVFSCVAAALDAKNLFEAPPGTHVDFTVEIDYGVSRAGGAARVTGMPATSENFLQLSARRPKQDGSPGKGEELWNVRVSVLEERVDLATLIPVLAAVAADYAGLDTQVEKSIKVSETSPNIVRVKSVARAMEEGHSAP